MPLLLLAFVLVPTIELVLLIRIGASIGALNTVLIVLVTAFVGAALLRREGLQTLLAARRRLDAGELPTVELVEGGLLVFTGALLLTPGFVTDLAGLLCLLPSVRRALAGALLERMVVQVGEEIMRPGAGGQAESRRGGTVIEGEFRRTDSDD